MAEAASRLQNSAFTRNDTGVHKNWMHALVEDSGAQGLAARWGAKMSDTTTRFWEGASSLGASTCAGRLVRRPAYQLARAMVILLDAVLVVWEMENAAQRAASGPYYSAAGVGDLPHFTVLLDISCACFLVDHLLRFMAGEFGAASSAGAGWQWFHAVVAVTQLLQALGHHSHRHQRSSSQFRVVLAMFSTLRLARVLSVVLVTSVIRQHCFFRELRIMVHALAGAVKVLLWSSLLIFTILLIFGTVLCEGTLAFLIRNERPTADAPGELQDQFGSLFDAVLTLFQSMSGGLDWGEVWDGLGAVGVFYRGVFLTFICFSLIAMLNVVTAVFIESTMARSMNDRGLVVQNEVMEKKDFLLRMRTIFRELDCDRDGTITVEELRKQMLDPDIGAYFSQLGMDPDQVGKLFQLLDKDQSGTLDPEEFMFGCLKFRGDAKSLDIAVLHQQVLWIHEALKVVVSHIGDCMISQQSVDIKSPRPSGNWVDPTGSRGTLADPTGSMGPPGCVERFACLPCQSP